MYLKSIILVFILSVHLQAMSIQTDKTTYIPSERVSISFQEMFGDSQDWVAIYPKGSTNAWINVLDWQWTDGVKTGTITLKNLPVGQYEARAFYRNSYTLEKSCDFSVDAERNDLNLSLNKSQYFEKDDVTVKFENMLGHDEDWIGIYPKGKDNKWDNMVQWEWTNGAKKGEVSFSALEVGEYEARAFYRNSFISESVIPFVVEKELEGIQISTDKSIYVPNELIYVTFNNMQGNETDWIGIYPAGSSYEFDNVIASKSTHGLKNGEVSFDGLEAGNYDIRAFFNNSLSKEAEFEITVTNKEVVSVVYEDAGNGLSPNWKHVSGNYAPLRANSGFQSTGALVLVTEWMNGGTQNIAEYHLDMNNSEQKVLEMDIGGVADYLLPNKNPNQVGYMSHFGVGVHVQTTNGTRRMIWDSFLNHGNTNAYISDYGNGNIWMYYPSPVEHVRGWYENIHTWQHFKVNIEKELRKLEPNNKIIKINYFIATGGFIDNLKLSSH